MVTHLPQPPHFQSTCRHNPPFRLPPPPKKKILLLFRYYHSFTYFPISSSSFCSFLIDTYGAASLYLMPSLFTPGSVAIKKGSQKRWKPTISESMRAFIAVLPVSILLRVLLHVVDGSSHECRVYCFSILKKLLFHGIHEETLFQNIL